MHQLYFTRHLSIELFQIKLGDTHAGELYKSIQ